MFDEEYKVVEAKSAPVGAANAVHLVTLPAILVKELGYLFVYLSYDNESAHWVHFDELKISHYESPVLQVNTYYPFGMPACTWLRDGEKENLYNYQGKEYDSLTRWHDFHARQYDAALGRWFAVDPQNQFASPYLAMGNNPVLMVGPDGELAWFVPIIVGGLINTAFNAGNIGNISDAFRYFAVGALTSAVTMGLTNGITAGFNFATYASGQFTFGQGFVVGIANTFSGSAAMATFASGTTSFLRGAAVGAASGFAGGFLSGMGNSLAGGSSFKTALNKGLEHGAIGGLSGGLIGGIAGGINAAKDGRSFFDGKRLINQESFSYNMPIVGGTTRATCGPASAQSIDNSYGGNITKEQIANWYGGTEKGVGDNTLWRDFGRRLGYKVSNPIAVDNNTLERLFMAMKNDTRGIYRFPISMKHWSGQDHSAVINSITKKTFLRISGKLAYKYVIQIMDPFSHGSYQNISIDSILKYWTIRR